MITPVLIVRNGERKLKEVLASLSSFDEILLADTGSTDRTLAIAKQFPNVKCIPIEFKGFGTARNEAAQAAKNDWILAIDADEVVSAELNEEIHRLSLDFDTVYAIPYHNYYNGKWIKGCGWHPESHVRLYNRKKTQFSSARLHEGVIVKECHLRILQNPIRHYSYETPLDFEVKLEKYSNLFAEEYSSKKRSTPFTAFSHGLFAFFKSYFLKRGFMMGREGFFISKYQAKAAYHKYMKLYLANKNYPC